MSGTMLACCFPFSIFAMIQTATSEVCQMLILLWHLVLMKMMTAIQFYHLADSQLLSLNPAHSLNFYFSWSQTFDVSTVKPSALFRSLGIIDERIAESKHGFHAIDGGCHRQLLFVVRHTDNLNLACCQELSHILLHEVVLDFRLAVNPHL